VDSDLAAQTQAAVQPQPGAQRYARPGCRSSRHEVTRYPYRRLRRPFRRVRALRPSPEIHQCGDRSGRSERFLPSSTVAKGRARAYPTSAPTNITQRSPARPPPLGSARAVRLPSPRLRIQQNPQPSSCVPLPAPRRDWLVPAGADGVTFGRAGFMRGAPKHCSPGLKRCESLETADLIGSSSTRRLTREVEIAQTMVRRREGRRPPAAVRPACYLCCCARAPYMGHALTTAGKCR